jgi:uncharacterized surface protein with fasciclin (FAS1) repeats
MRFLCKAGKAATGAAALLLAACAGQSNTPETSMAAAAPAGPTATKDIVGTAATGDDLSTLVVAVQRAGLVETLQGEGPYTVFAPTDAAFAKLPPGTVDDLLKPENRDQLVAVLTYHVVPGKVMSSDIAGTEMMVATAQGSELDVDATSGVKINDANVTTADIQASNGVIHVIDTVLIPQ